MDFHILFRGFDNQFIESVVLNKFKHICVKYRARDEIVTHLRNDSPFFSFLSFPGRRRTFFINVFEIKFNTEIKPLFRYSYQQGRHFSSLSILNPFSYNTSSRHVYSN